MGHPSPITTTAPPLLRPLLILDATTSHYLHTLTRPLTPKSLLVILEILADFRFFFPVILSLFFATPSSSPLRKHLLFPLIVCSLLDLIFIALVKFFVRRSRPLYANHEEYNAVVSVDNFSFPSGHSSRVCFVASLFYFSQAAILNAMADLKTRGHPRFALFIDQWISGNEMMAVNLLVLVVCVWALVTAFSRIILGRHYVLDVLVGSCLGVLEALFTIHLLRFQVLS